MDMAAVGHNCHHVDVFVRELTCIWKYTGHFVAAQPSWQPFFRKVLVSNHQVEKYNLVLSHYIHTRAHTQNGQKNGLYEDLLCQKSAAMWWFQMMLGVDLDFYSSCLVCQCCQKTLVSHCPNLQCYSFRTRCHDRPVLTAITLLIWWQRCLHDNIFKLTHLFTGAACIN